MAKKKKTEEEEAEKGGGGGKLKLAIGAVVLVVIGAVLGGKVLGGGGAETASAMEAVTTTTEPPGPVTTLDAITLNLIDGRFLKLGLAFEIHHDRTYPEDPMADTITLGFAREVDAAIAVFGSFGYEDLISPAGKNNAKRMLLEEIQRISDGAVRDVYFHQFVMQ